MKYSKRATVIVPIYNQEPYLKDSIPSLLAQTMPPDDFEILLIDDGSTDESPSICDEYARRYDNVRVIHKANGGLSDARNCGIDNARGRYLFFLDGDDTLKEDTLFSVTNFFDEHYDDIDLVAYPSITKKEGKESTQHYRYKYLDHTGIYDLTEGENIYAAITRIEVCVKNLGESNVHFSLDPDFRHEDQKYCTDVILDKLKIGYIEEGEYRYRPNEYGLQSMYFYAYYLYEPTMAFWEEEFAKYANSPVPRYLQALYVSDISWKLRTTKLIPYHYDVERLKMAKSRIVALLQRVDNEVILGHPAVDKQQKYFWIRLKSTQGISLIAGNESFSLYDGDVEFYTGTKVEITILRFIPTEKGLRLNGYLKNPSLALADDVSLYARVESSGVEARIEIPLQESAWNYYKCKVETTRILYFEHVLEIPEAAQLRYEVILNGQSFPTSFYFSANAIFSRKKPKRLSFVACGYIYSYSKAVISAKKLSQVEMTKAEREYEQLLFKKNKGIWLYRFLAKRTIAAGRRIWLYHDCHGVEKNNAYYQFIHDFQMDDGVERYYVVNDPLKSKEHLFSKEQMRNVISFRSKRHRVLFLSAELILTAYVERKNWMAFDYPGMKDYMDVFRAKVVYLQHGVLHATLPWKYSYDRMTIDYEVVSTNFEVDNLTHKYHFDEKRLIKSGMPRYDFIGHDAVPKKKILLAPSWRKYLVRQKPDGQWLPVERIFLESGFYKELDKLLHSSRLDRILRESGYSLDVKLHPILAELYEEFISTDSSQIHIASPTVNDEDYAVFITDFSSYRFDFVYLKRAIAYFLPDEDMYRSGMCDYRNNDLPLEGQFGDMARTAEELIDLICRIIDADAQPEERYQKQMDGFFFHYDNNQRDRLYKRLIEIMSE